MARRRPRRIDRLRRPAPRREPYDRVLVVCEGEKTEPHYFQELVDHCRLSTANIRIVGRGSDPRALIGKAGQLLREEKRSGDTYDEVYCVFDRDEHVHFEAASKQARSAGFELARSWPCFEFWLLLHFTYSRSPYAPSGGRTAAQNCVRDLQAHFPDYEKTGRGVFTRLLDRLKTAEANARGVWADAEATDERNPCTEVHRLVAYLMTLPG